MEVFLTLIAPGTFNLETLIISWSKATCLSNTTEVIISEAKGAIFESSLIIILTLIGFHTSFLRDAFDSSTFTFVILTVHVSTNHPSCEIRRLMCTSTA